MQSPAAPPDVAIHPPVLGAIALVAGLVLDWLIGWDLGGAETRWPRLLAGGVLVAAGIVVGALAVQRFRRAGTNMPTFLPAKALVTDGIYAYSRNPGYVAALALLLGLGLLLDSPGILVLWPAVALILHYGVVRREEAYLVRLFGQPYLDYRQRVRRWL
jgi:protein-S-isoprenylcysteine O-methyltransferase Ste14